MLELFFYVLAIGLAYQFFQTIRPGFGNMFPPNRKAFQ